MKAILIVFITFMSTTVLASDLVDLINGKKRLCSSPLVRLSPKPIPCLIDELEDGQFDLPSLELDFDDLEDVFNGAESSGGHVIGPMNNPRRTTGPVTPFPVNLRCQALLLSDGGKKVSFLSKQSFDLSSMSFSTYLFSDLWIHGIVEGSDLSLDNWMQVPVTPNIEFKNYSVTLGYNKRSRKPILTACEANLKTAEGATVAACSEVEFSRYSYSVKMRLKTLIIKENIRIQKTLDINCKL